VFRVRSSTSMIGLHCEKSITNSAGGQNHRALKRQTELRDHLHSRKTLRSIRDRVLTTNNYPNNPNTTAPQSNTSSLLLLKARRSRL
jgi:hypothetical protein